MVTGHSLSVLLLYCSLKIKMVVDLTTIEFLNPAELATYLNVSKVFVYRLIYKRLIPFYKVGRNIRFRKTDILDYLESVHVKSIT